MKIEITELKSKLLSQIQEAARIGQIETVIKLSPQLEELGKLEALSFEVSRRLAELQNPIPRLTMNRNSAMPRLAYRGSKREQTRLRITINWSTLGRPLSDEILQDHFANQTQAKFISRLIEIMGLEIVDRALHYSRTQESRMHVSKTPLSDSKFINQATGEPFHHKPIPGTDLFILTNTSTEEKQRDLENFVRFCGLPVTAFKIEIVSK